MSKLTALSQAARAKMASALREIAHKIEVGQMDHVSGGIMIDNKGNNITIDSDLVLLDLSNPPVVTPNFHEVYPIMETIHVGESHTVVWDLDEREEFYTWSEFAADRKNYPPSLDGRRFATFCETGSTKYTLRIKRIL